MTAPLLTCQNLDKSYGSKELFTELSFSIPPFSRIALVGPNGAGKSTLLKVLARHESPDNGQVIARKDLKVGYAPQSSQFDETPVKELMLLMGGDEVRVDTLMSQFNLPNIPANQLSGGWQKRLDLALAILHDPDLLILDEPTNHLDIESIEWLEKWLKKQRRTLFFTSHDRKFLQNVATYTLELNPLYPEGLFYVEGDYETFLNRKALYLEQLRDYQTGLSSKVRREEAWLRTTPQARTTKSKSRVDQAERLIEELNNIQRRLRTKKLSVAFTGTERETRKLASAKNIGKTYNGKTLFDKLDITLTPGIKVGIVGPNGSGKSTLLKTLANELDPDTGTIKFIDGVNIVYFDQNRIRIPTHLSIREALSSGEYVTYMGKTIHVNSWGKKFFFTPEQMNLPLSYLSGGERARVSLAKMMLEPADILFLDEPTNDLDIDTLEVLEESLAEFPGAVVLISHDRTLIEKTCDKLIALDVEGHFCEDLMQYERMKRMPPEIQQTPVKAPVKPATTLKVSYKEKYEYETLSEKIKVLEEEVASLHNLIEENPPLDRLQELSIALSRKEAELETSLHRWAELDDKITTT